MLIQTKMVMKTQMTNFIIYPLVKNSAFSDNLMTFYKWYFNICSNNGMSLNLWEAIVYTNDEAIHWIILDHEVLKATQDTYE